jgi:hypothetical protein
VVPVVAGVAADALNAEQGVDAAPELGKSEICTFNLNTALWLMWKWTMEYLFMFGFITYLKMLIELLMAECHSCF